MSPSEATPQFRGIANLPYNQETPAISVELDELRQPHTSANLARGIVWADILADIAADEQARLGRVDDTPRLRDAA